jgi:glucosamine--fructose-6-phosphate aminotransferase (isomerizing)
MMQITMTPHSSADSTRMYAEAHESGAAVRRQIHDSALLYRALGARLREQPPKAIVTCARGSSDHATTYAKYLIEMHTGIPVSSAAPSMSSMYGVAPHLKDCLYIAVSQSGRSPDLLTSVQAARAGGAFVIALCNDDTAPLNSCADVAIPLCAGPEVSVAATKSYVASLAAFLQLVGAWTQRADLADALAGLGDDLDESFALDWSAATETLATVQHLYVIGRGLGLGASQEIALKSKETCALHAEAFSGAEVRHGPFSLLGPDFPALIVGQHDVTRPGLAALVPELLRRGVPTLHAGLGISEGTVLPVLERHPAIQPALHAVSAYRMLASLSVRRGLDPDRPPYLRKVTETH